MDEKAIIKQMEILGITREEAIELLEADDAIDHGEKLFSLSDEQEKASKAARQVARKAGTTAKREHKEKPEKVKICGAMQKGLAELGIQNFEITNPEREFLFTYDGVKYKVTLACPRK